MSKPYVSTMPLDLDRPMLEQLEAAAVSSPDDQDSEWLVKRIYRNPRIMSLLTGIRLAPLPKSRSSART